jgi:hypothetical protein
VVDEKLCPLLAIGMMARGIVPDIEPLAATQTGDPDYSVCRREACAWWVDFGKKPRCAVVVMGVGALGLLTERVIRKDPPSTPLSRLDGFRRLTLRARKAIERLGTPTIASVTSFAWDDFRSMRNTGPQSIREIREWFASHGLVMRERWGDPAPAEGQQGESDG